VLHNNSYVTMVSAAVSKGLIQHTIGFQILSQMCVFFLFMFLSLNFYNLNVDKKSQSVVSYKAVFSCVSDILCYFVTDMLLI